ncbi:MAG: LysR family transcriptional regulator [Burkholderiales bacterium]
MIELRLVRHALALNRFRNFARAAEALHLTQPSLSRSIAALEEMVGVQLFDRGKRGVEPTAFGKLVLERGEALLAGEAGLRRELQLLAGLDTGTLAVGAGPYPTEISVGTAVTRLLRTHPRLQVRVVTADPDEIARKVLAGEFDVGVANAHTLRDTARLQIEALPAHHVLLACRPGHPLAGVRGLELKDVLQFPLVSTLLGGAAAKTAAAFERAGSIDPDTGNVSPAIHVSSLSLARRIASGSDALFPATASIIADDLESGRLVTLDFHVPAMRTDHSLITSRGRSLPPAARAFIGLVREVEAEIAAAEAKQLPARSTRAAAPRRQPSKASSGARRSP